MKRLLSNIMATTGITLVVLAIIARMFSGNVIFISCVFQSLLVNILLHLGYMFLSKIEFRFWMLGTVMKVIYTYIIILPSGAIFGWYQNMPLWCLALMTLVIYVCGAAIDTISVMGEVKEINSLLDERKVE